MPQSNPAITLHWRASRAEPPDTSPLRIGPLGCVLIRWEDAAQAGAAGTEWLSALRAAAAGGPSPVLLTDQLQTLVHALLQAGAAPAGGASMAPMLSIVLADAPTEAQMHDCTRAGVQDMVPPAFAQHCLQELLNRHLDSAGVVRGAREYLAAEMQVQQSLQRMQSDVDFYAELLRAFLDEIPERRSALAQAWAHNARQVSQLCHSVKGLAQTFGLVRLSSLAGRVETYAADAAKQSAECQDGDLLLRLDAELQSSHYLMLRWLDTQGPAAQPQS